MLVKLVEIYNNKSFERRSEGASFSENFSLREVYINPEHIVCIRNNDTLREKVQFSNLSDEFMGEQQFTKVYINRGQSGLDLDVVGDINTIQGKIYGTQKILNG